MTSEHPQPGVHPAIKVRPTRLFLAAVLLGLLLDHLLPLPRVVPRDEGLAHKIIPGVMSVTGALLGAGGIRDLMRSATPVPTNQPVRALVVHGLHAWSRNPIYVGMLLLYLGIGVGVRSSWLLALTPAIILVLRYAVIAREEAYLEQLFGELYLDYKARVRRWI